MVLIPQSQSIVHRCRALPIEITKAQVLRITKTWSSATFEVMITFNTLEQYSGRGSILKKKHDRE